MNILHYTLGLPPNRSGGLTRYATDLMLAQVYIKERVSMLYPGDFTFWKKTNPQIREKQPMNGISIYEILNPCPVPLLYGVKTPHSILNAQKIADSDLNAFYDDLKPDVFHIHTLMGLPPELVTFFKDKGVKVIFTSHDYYGLCLKVNFINQNNDFCSSPTGKNCAKCNSNSPSDLFLRVRNSDYILRHKNSFMLRNKKSSSVKKTPQKQDNIYNISSEEIDAYTSLQNFYKDLFEQIDCFHFNSSVSESVFKSFVDCPNSNVISITHAGIHDNRKLKKFEDENLKIAFIGSLDTYKGFNMLRDVMIGLSDENILNWSLTVWGNGTGIDPKCQLIEFKGKYKSEDLEKVFEEIDLLIVPSVCKETFSLITLEALSYGVPVLLTSNVGAKDLIQIYDESFIIEPTKDAIDKKMRSLLKNKNELIRYNQKINTNIFNLTLDKHVVEINKLYNSIV